MPLGAPRDPLGAPLGPLGPLGPFNPALAWLACLSCLALAWSGLGLESLGIPKSPIFDGKKRRRQRRPGLEGLGGFGGACCHSGPVSEGHAVIPPQFPPGAHFSTILGPYGPQGAQGGPYGAPMGP